MTEFGNYQVWMLLCEAPPWGSSKGINVTGRHGP